MARHSNDPTPPENLPDDIASELTQLSAGELRKTIIYAQELLNFEDENPSPVEPNPGDEILSVTEHDGYTEVVKYVYANVDGEEIREGPFHYHVTEERHPDGSIKPYWKFIGKIDLEDD